MDTERLQDILNCPSLPSIPAVAAKVIELTADPDVKMGELAEQITIDQALASKVLRTVNSSFYGLRNKCASIEKALVLLGLGPVKSLVLGFSLTEALRPDENGGFDYDSYWRRGLHAAIGAKITANAMGYEERGEECFLVGLLEDIGMIAMHRAMPKEYTELLVETGDDHAVLAREEIKVFDIQHAEVSASVCERWRMPEEICVPLRFHERPTACPTEYAKTARCVGMGNLIHGVLNAQAPSMPLAKLYERAQSWFGMSESRVDDLVTETGGATKELASVFDVSLGSYESPREVLARADRQLIDLPRSSLAGSYSARQVTEGEGVKRPVSSDVAKDELTGVLNREGFKHAIGQVYSTVKPGEIDVSIVQLSLDGLAQVRENIGAEAHDDVIVGTATILTRYFEPMGGAVCRVSDMGFGVVLPEITHDSAMYVASAVRDEFARAVKGWIPGISDLDRFVRVNIGVATLDEGSAATFPTPDLLVLASSEAIRAARAREGSAVVGLRELATDKAA